MKCLSGLCLSVFFTAVSGNACTIDGREGFLPENDLRIEVGARNANIDEKEFNSILDRIEAVFSPIVAAKGKKLVIDRGWQDAAVNAYSTESEDVWLIHMAGGIARHPDVTPDGFALVACHEMGHHLGGVPKKTGFLSWLSHWAATEGQADYYASLKCFRMVFGGDPNPHSADTDATAREGCEKSFASPADERVCERATNAGRSLGKLIADLAHDPVPQFSTPDLEIVGSTLDGYPSTQCRMDTYFQGAICDVPASIAPSDQDPNVGTCSVETGAKWGYRPACWYRAS